MAEEGPKRVNYDEGSDAEVGTRANGRMAGQGSGWLYRADALL